MAAPDEGHEQTGPTADLTAVHPPPLEAELVAAAPPRRLGRYELQQALGQGGMGEVWRARDGNLEREVALKLLAPAVAGDPEARARFLREARAAARVNHPCVVTVLDADEAEGRVFMALELMRGGDALGLLRTHQGRVPEVRALEVARDCAEGLVALEAAGIVHRDIKPANVFLTPEGRAKLGDLGLARSDAGDDKITRTGLVLGTPAYMPPEQAEGLALDTRADVYSLGATLFHLLTGRAPFTGPNLMAVMSQVLTAAPPEPQTLVPGLSAGTARLLRRCLAKTPAERFGSARELQTALEQALRGARAAAQVAPPSGRPIRAPSGRSPAAGAAATERAGAAGSPPPSGRGAPLAVLLGLAAPLLVGGLLFARGRTPAAPPTPPDRPSPQAAAAQPPRAEPEAAPASGGDQALAAPTVPDPPRSAPPAGELPALGPTRPVTTHWRPVPGQPGAPDLQQVAGLLPAGPTHQLAFDGAGRGRWARLALQDVQGQRVPCQLRWTLEGVRVPPGRTDRAVESQGFVHPAGVFCELGARSRSDPVYEGAALTGQAVWAALQFDDQQRVHVLVRAVDASWRQGSLDTGVPGLRQVCDGVVPIDPGKLAFVLELGPVGWRAKLENARGDLQLGQGRWEAGQEELAHGPAYAWTHLGNWQDGEGAVERLTVETRPLE